jgi:hypothetical protein
MISSKTPTWQYFLWVLAPRVWPVSKSLSMILIGIQTTLKRTILPPPKKPTQTLQFVKKGACWREDSLIRGTLQGRYFPSKIPWRQGLLPRVVTRTIEDGWTDGRTMATRSSMTWTHCSVRYKLYLGDKLARQHWGELRPCRLTQAFGLRPRTLLVCADAACSSFPPVPLARPLAPSLASALHERTPERTLEKNLK